MAGIKTNADQRLYSEMFILSNIQVIGVNFRLFISMGREIKTLLSSDNLKFSFCLPLRTIAELGFELEENFMQ